VYLVYLPSRLSCHIIGNEAFSRALALTPNLAYRNVPRESRIKLAESLALVMQLKAETVGNQKPLRPEQRDIDNLTCTLYFRESSSLGCIKGKIKLSLSLIKHHATKIYRKWR
jgi:hypothetical protein